jgi:CxxC motif-containing protein
MPVLPVRTNGEVPKEKITEIMRELSKIKITERTGIGETVAADILGTGCDIIATSDIISTSDMLREKNK